MTAFGLRGTSTAICAFRPALSAGSGVDCLPFWLFLFLVLTGVPFTEAFVLFDLFVSSLTFLMADAVLLREALVDLGVDAAASAVRLGRIEEAVISLVFFCRLGFGSGLGF